MSRVPDHIALDPRTDSAVAYLWLEAGQARPFVNRRRSALDRAICNLVMATFVAAAFAAMLAAASDQTPAPDAAARLEQLRTIERHADFITPGVHAAPWQSSETAK
jgi:hypothetical protein